MHHSELPDFADDDEINLTDSERSALVWSDDTIFIDYSIG